MYLIEKYGRRYWAVRDEGGDLVAVTVYRKGAREVARRLEDVTEAKNRERDEKGDEKSCQR